MRIKDLHIYSTDQMYLVKLREEYTLYGDFKTTLELGCLTVHSYRRLSKPRKAKRKKR